jgi:hypothetical protein
LKSRKEKCCESQFIIKIKHLDPFCQAASELKAAKQIW